MRNASAQIIEMDKEVKKLTNLSKEEVEILDSRLKNNYEEDGLFGKPTKWKLAQAVNSISRDVSPERKKELDDFAGELIGFNID